MIKQHILLVAFSLLFCGHLPAEERPDHSKGKPAPSLEIALGNLKESNTKLAEYLKKDTLTALEMHEIHMLSYTIEVALEKIKQEQTVMAELMEELHLASEKNDAKTVKASGSAFLKKTEPLVK